MRQHVLLFLTAEEVRQRMQQFARGEFRPDPADGNFLPPTAPALGLTGNLPTVIDGVKVYDRRNRYQAEHVITYNPAVVPVLLEYLRDDDPRVRGIVLYALEAMTGERLGSWQTSLDDPDFRAALKDWQHRVRAWHSREQASFRSKLAAYSERRAQGEVY